MCSISNDANTPNKTIVVQLLAKQHVPETENGPDEWPSRGTLSHKRREFQILSECPNRFRVASPKVRRTEAAGIA